MIRLSAFISGLVSINIAWMKTSNNQSRFVSLMISGTVVLCCLLLAGGPAYGKPLAVIAMQAGGYANHDSGGERIVPLLVFPISTVGMTLSSPELSAVREILSVNLARGGRFSIMAESDIRKRLSEQKVTSWDDCFDDLCRIELGAAIHADVGVVSKILKVSDECSLSVTMYDFRTELTIDASTVDFDCSVKGLKAAVISVAATLRGDAPQPVSQIASQPAAVAGNAPPVVVNPNQARGPRDDGTAVRPSRSGKQPSAPSDPAGHSWVYVPGGTFRMGDPDGQADERPVHDVTLPPFFVTRTEVTVEQYSRCVQAGRCSEPGVEKGCTWVNRKAGMPVNCVTWAQAEQFAAWAGGRLPAESEWEFVARGGSGGFAWASATVAPQCPGAIIRGVTPGCGQNGPALVCSLRADSPTGRPCDLDGNLREWVRDWYSARYEPGSTAPGYVGPKRGSLRSVRGAGWLSFQAATRSAARDAENPDRFFIDVGFRVVVPAQ